VIPKELRYRILQHLKERERTGTLPRLEDVATALGQPAEEVGDQLDILEEMGAIKANRTLGGGAAPFLLARGKMLLEELDDQFGHRGSIEDATKQIGSEPDYQWDAFIAHASEDKESFVRPLADALSRYVRVWYDEFTMTVGDSLRQKIDEGLATSRFGIVVLSPNFFAKKWPQDELDGLAARERDGTKVILPIWLDIDEAGVTRHSPTIAARYAAKAADGLDVVVRDLLRAMEREGHSPRTQEEVPVLREPAARPVQSQRDWDEDQARPRFAVEIRGASTLESTFCPEFRVAHFSGDRIPSIGWRLRGPRFDMDWEQIHVGLLDRRSLTRSSNLSRQQHADADLSPDQMGLEIAFSWRGQDRTELHRWPLTRNEHPTKAMWSIGAEILPSLER
jgi:hypothetical protein